MGKVKYFVKAGFTLIELLIVIAILAILAAAVMIAINPAKRMQEARDATRLADTSQISNSIAEYNVTHGTYPPDPSLSSETEFASDEGPNWIPGLDNLPQDPNQAGIISTLASLFNMKSEKPADTTSKPQVAGEQSITITSSTNGKITFGGNYSYQYPNDYLSPCTATLTRRDWPYPGENVGQQDVPMYVPPVWKSTYRLYRSYFTFDTSVIPPEAVIESASLAFFLSGPHSPNFNLLIRKFDWGDTLTCPPSGSTSGGDWDGNPPTSQLLASANTAGLVYSSAYRSNINLDTTGINKGGLTKIMLSSDREENNIKPEQYNMYELVSITDSTGSEPQLTITYSIPDPSPPPESPPPSPPPKSCKNKKHIFCYMVTEDRYNAILWAQLENEEDKRIYYKPTATCKNTPPPDYFFNYCINNP